MNPPILKGKNIVVTRAAHQQKHFNAILKKNGAHILFCPTIKIIPPLSIRPLTHAIHSIQKFDWIIFTSANGVEHFMKEFRNLIPSKKIPPKIKMYAIGPATAAIMRKRGLKVTRISREYVAESILNDFKNIHGKKILIPRATDARAILPHVLKKRGAEVWVVPVYRTVSDKSKLPTLKKWIQSNKISCVTFTSSSTVKYFFTLLNSTDKKKVLSNRSIVAASIGPITTNTLNTYKWPPAIIAAKPTTEHLAEAIIQHYRGLK